MLLKEHIDSNRKNVKFTFHALKQFQEANLEVREVLIALRAQFQIIEEYPDDPRGSSVLILLFIEDRPIHLVVAPHEDVLIIITGYCPNKDTWIKNYSQRS